MIKEKNIILKTILKFILILGLMLFVLNISAFAANLPDSGKESFISSNLPVPSGSDGVSMFKEVVLSTASYVKTLAAVFGILMIVLIGVKMVVKSDDEDTITTSKKGLTYAIIAFVLLSMSEDIAKIFDMSKGTILGSPQEILKRVNIFDKQVALIMTFVKYIIGAVAGVTFTRAAVKMVVSGGDEEEQGNAKKMLMYPIAALMMLFVGEIFITKVIYKVDTKVYSGITGVHPSFDAKEGIDQMVGITNFIVGFVGPVAVLALVIGGLMYSFSAGNEDTMEKAKRIVIAAFVGIIIIYGAFAIVSTVIAGKLENIGAIAA